ncbi:hypothetical protein OG426_09315 [Streptomyces canus]|uniref:hypothetical protein n=1 Tax=Streptomyces canus TaxID=58343 RepID=UPI00386C7706|nr:hypothetical protein OG426_09315 [Streptomyces canus]
MEQAQAEVDAARERVERARVGREELVSVLAEESPVNTPVSVPSGGGAAAHVGSSGSGAEHGERRPVWRSGMGEEVLGGLYREAFAAVVAASGPVNGVELTRAVGREADIKNEVEKIRGGRRDGWRSRSWVCPCARGSSATSRRWTMSAGHHSWVFSDRSVSCRCSPSLGLSRIRRYWRRSG